MVVLKCQRPESVLGCLGETLGSQAPGQEPSGEMGVSGMPPGAAAPQALGKCPGAQPPPADLVESALLSRLIGNGSYQAKGAGAQPRSLDSSPTHGCPTLGRQRTSGLWCNSNQVSSPPVGGGRATVTWGPASQLPYPDLCPWPTASCLPPVSILLCLPLLLLPSSLSVFIFLFALLSLSACLCSCMDLLLFSSRLCPTSPSTTSAPSLEAPSSCLAHPGLHPHLSAPPWSQLLLP